jgi:hypothetical protein
LGLFFLFWTNFAFGTEIGHTPHFFHSLAGSLPMANIKIFLGITLFVITTVAAVTRWRKPEILWTPKTMVIYVAAFVVSFMLAGTLGFIGGGILYGF